MRGMVMHGFSLLEVMVTLFLIAILVGMVVPYLGSGQLESLRAAAARFRQVLIWLRDQSAFGETEYRLLLDFDHATYRCERLQAGVFVPVNDPLLQPTTLAPAIGRMTGPNTGRWGSDGHQASLRFVRSAPEKPIVVRFTNAEATEGFTVSDRPEWHAPRLEQGLPPWP